MLKMIVRRNLAGVWFLGNSLHSAGFREILIRNVRFKAVHFHARHSTAARIVLPAEESDQFVEPFPGQGFAALSDQV